MTRRPRSHALRHTRLRWRAVLLAVAMASTVVIIAAVPATAQNPCGVPAASSWTPTEITIWQQLCTGQEADLNPPGQTLDPTKPDGWDNHRALSSAFVEQLFTQPYAAAIDRHGIRLRGAWFPNGLDIHDAAISFPLRCQACRIAGLQADDTVIDGDLDLRGSTIDGDLSLHGATIRSDLLLSDSSVVSGTLTAERLNVAGYVFLRDRSKFTDINLRGANIGQNLEADNGSVVSGTLTADRLNVAGSVFLRDGSTFTDINLRGANIGSNFEVGNGSVVSGTLDADRAKVAGYVFLRDGSKFNTINLRGANIGQNLEADNGSVVAGTLTADRLNVAGNVFLGDGSKFNNINLLGADIGSTLEAQGGSVISGTLTADRLKVAGNVFLRDGSTFNNLILPGANIGGLLLLNGAKWTSNGTLDLGQARAGGVWTDDRADSWPHTIRLNGFEFRQWANPDPQTLGSDWFTGTWLARLDTFSPGPYNQLAAVLDATGHPTIAADVRYHRSHTERLQTPWSRPERWGRQLYWLVLGYGFHPWWALGWFFTAWLTGSLVFRTRLQPNPTPDEAADGPPPGRLRRWRDRIATVARIRPVKAEGWTAGQAAMYSLDRLLPAFKLVDPDDFPTRTRAQQVWSVVQMLLGWLLTLFIIGWLGSLLTQP